MDRQPSLSELDNHPARKGGLEAIEEELDRVFDYHAPKGHIQYLHQEWRKHVKWFGRALMTLPATRERAMALTRLEEASFWVHATIARNHDAFSAPPAEEPSE